MTFNNHDQNKHENTWELVKIMPNSSTRSFVVIISLGVGNYILVINGQADRPINIHLKRHKSLYHITNYSKVYTSDASYAWILQVSANRQTKGLMGQQCDDQTGQPTYQYND